MAHRNFDDWPIEHGDFPVRYVGFLEGNNNNTNINNIINNIIYIYIYYYILTINHYLPSFYHELLIITYINNLYSPIFQGLVHSTTVQHHFTTLWDGVSRICPNAPRYLATTPLATALGTDDVEQHDQGKDPEWGTTLDIPGIF